MASKTARLIVQPQLAEKVPYHDMTRAREEVGPSYTYINNTLIPEADMCISILHVKKVPINYRSHVETHTHPVSQAYVIIGDLTLEVLLGGEKHEVSGPAGIFIPANTPHANRPLKGSGFIVAVTRGAKYE